MINKQTNYKQYKAMGNDINNIYKDLRKFTTNPNYQDLLTAKLIDDLLKIIGKIEIFKVRAEDRMFAKECPPRSDDQIWLGLFYPDK